MQMNKNTEEERQGERQHFNVAFMQLLMWSTDGRLTNCNWQIYTPSFYRSLVCINFLLRSVTSVTYVHFMLTFSDTINNESNLFYHYSIYEDIGDYNPRLSTRDSRKSKDMKKDKHHYFERTSRGETHVSSVLLYRYSPVNIITIGRSMLAWNMFEICYNFKFSYSTCLFSPPTGWRIEKTRYAFFAENIAVLCTLRVLQLHDWTDVFSALISSVKPK